MEPLFNSVLKIKFVRIGYPLCLGMWSALGRLGLTHATKQ